MTSHVNRRNFLKVTGAAGVGIGLTGWGGAGLLSAAEAAKGAPNAQKLGWLLGSQAWTFRLFPLFETIDKLNALGLHYVETGTGRALTKDRPNVTFDENSPPAVLAEVKKKLADSHVKVISHWPGALSKNIDEARKVFEFAKGFGIENLVGEPSVDALDTLDKLANEYGINIAIHNHPKGSSYYWNPDTVLEVCKGRSKRIGACADTGHWKRSGLDTVECIKKLKGRIIEFHLKDISPPPDQHDVVWGTGTCNVKGMLAEVYQQKFKGFFAVEYEYHWENSMPEIAESVAYFDKVAADLAAQDAGAPARRVIRRRRTQPAS
jgi:sugar phosphate isomerase/epimerase